MSESVIESNEIVPQTSTQESLQASDVVLGVKEKHKNLNVKPRRSNRNLLKSCPVCSKVMRSDHIKRHLKRHDVSAKSKYPKQDSKKCGTLKIGNRLARHSKVKNILQKLEQPLAESRDEIFKRICHNQQVFEQKIMLGRRVRQILLDYYFDPMSLSKNDKEALELYEYFNTDAGVM